MTATDAPGLRVGLLGAFGIGNRGNDVTLEAFVEGLSGDAPGPALAERPRVVPVAVCPAPGTVASTGTRAVSWTRPRSGTSLAARLAARCGDVAWTWRVVRGLDAVVLAGGGLLEVTRLRASTTAWTVAAYTWAAHLQRKPVVFWSVGADDLPRGAARSLVHAALHGADTVAVRDDHSRRAVEGLDHRTPAVVLDAVLALPTGPSEPTEPPRSASTGSEEAATVVGVGVFNGRGATGADGAPLDADRYESELCRTVCGLVRAGDDVVLLGGAAIDEEVLDDLADRCAHDLGPEFCHVHRGAFGDYAEARRTLADVDLAVVSRYHSVAAALTAGTPTVSVGYGPKNRDLMARFGQAEYCADLPTARADDVLRLLESLRLRAVAEVATIVAAGERLRTTARTELNTLASILTRSPAPVRR